MSTPQVVLHAKFAPICDV